MKYRSPAPLAMAASLAVVANLASRLFFVGVAQRQAWLATFVVAVALSLSFVYRAARNLSVLAVNGWLGFWVAATVAPFALAGVRVDVFVAVALNMAQGVAFIVVVLGIAARQREQWLDLEQRRAVPAPTANTLR